MRENYEKGMEIVGKLSIEIGLRRKCILLLGILKKFRPKDNDDWFIIVIEQNENKIKTEFKKILFYCQP